MYGHVGPGYILTVADDFLKNNGQKCLKIIEQLAESRIQRAEEAAAVVGIDTADDEDDEEGDEDEDDEDDDYEQSHYVSNESYQIIA
jgi:LmbE family N-acetylglucosaminyl deacetylase